MWDAIGEALGDAPSSREQRRGAGATELALLRGELDNVRDCMAKFEGVYQPGKNYSPNTLCVAKGSLWISKEITADEPGTSSTWQLITKRGDFRQRTP